MKDSRHHSFDITFAEKYGLVEAILIHHFQHWISYNKKLNRNFKEGKTWTYQTFDEICAHYPYLGREEIRYALDRLCNGKSRKSEKIVDFEPILLRKNFNKTGFDRTYWYAFSNNSYEEGISHFDKSNCPNGSVEMPTPIPHTIPHTKTDKREREEAQAPPPPIFSQKRVKMEKEKYDRLVQDHGKEKIEEMIERLDEYADINPKRFKQYACHAAVIRKWIRDDKDKQKNFPKKPSESNHEWAKWIVAALYLQKKIDTRLVNVDVGKEAIAFIFLNHTDYIKYTEHGFRDQVRGKFAKMGIQLPPDNNS